VAFSDAPTTSSAHALLARFSPFAMAAQGFTSDLSTFRIRHVCSLPCLHNQSTRFSRKNSSHEDIVHISASHLTISSHFEVKIARTSTPDQDTVAAHVMKSVPVATKEA